VSTAYYSNIGTAYQRAKSGISFRRSIRGEVSATHSPHKRSISHMISLQVSHKPANSKQVEVNLRNKSNTAFRDIHILHNSCFINYSIYIYTERERERERFI